MLVLFSATMFLLKFQSTKIKLLCHIENNVSFNISKLFSILYFTEWTFSFVLVLGRILIFNITNTSDFRWNVFEFMFINIFTASYLLNYKRRVYFVFA